MGHKRVRNEKKKELTGLRKVMKTNSEMNTEL